MATGSEFDQFRHNREIEEAQANFYNHRQNSSQSLWSCFKNAVRKKKCTCHLNYLGKSLATFSSPENCSTSKALEKKLKIVFCF